jgi:hypothetical protein
MMQGDSYSIGFTVLNNARVPVTPEDIDDVEITIGHLRKTYRNAQVAFYDDKWMFPLTQKESFGYFPKSTRANIRIRWKNGVVEGKEIHGVNVRESLSKEVL